MDNLTLPIYEDETGESCDKNCEWQTNFNQLNRIEFKNSKNLLKVINLVKRRLDQLNINHNKVLNKVLSGVFMNYALMCSSDNSDYEPTIKTEKEEQDFFKYALSILNHFISFIPKEEMLRGFEQYQSCFAILIGCHIEIATRIKDLSDDEIIRSTISLLSSTEKFFDRRYYTQVLLFCNKLLKRPKAAEHLYAHIIKLPKVQTPLSDEHFSMVVYLSRNILKVIPEDKKVSFKSALKLFIPDESITTGVFSEHLPKFNKLSCAMEKCLEVQNKANFGTALRRFVRSSAQKLRSQHSTTPASNNIVNTIDSDIAIVENIIPNIDLCESTDELRDELSWFKYCKSVYNMAKNQKDNKVNAFVSLISDDEDEDMSDDESNQNSPIPSPEAMEVQIESSETPSPLAIEPAVAESVSASAVDSVSSSNVVDSVSSAIVVESVTSSIAVESEPSIVVQSVSSAVVEPVSSAVEVSVTNHPTETVEEEPQPEPMEVGVESIPEPSPEPEKEPVTEASEESSKFDSYEKTDREPINALPHDIAETVNTLIDIYENSRSPKVNLGQHEKNNLVSTAQNEEPPEIVSGTPDQLIPAMEEIIPIIRNDFSYNSPPVQQIVEAVSQMDHSSHEEISEMNDEEITLSSSLNGVIVNEKESNLSEELCHINDDNVVLREEIVFTEEVSEPIQSNTDWTDDVQVQVCPSEFSNTLSKSDFVEDFQPQLNSTATKRIHLDQCPLQFDDHSSNRLKKVCKTYPSKRKTKAELKDISPILEISVSDDFGPVLNQMQEEEFSSVQPIIPFLDIRLEHSSSEESIYDESSFYATLDSDHVAEYVECEENGIVQNSLENPPSPDLSPSPPHTATGSVDAAGASPKGETSDEEFNGFAEMFSPHKICSDAWIQDNCHNLNPRVMLNKSIVPREIERLKKSSVKKKKHTVDDNKAVGTCESVQPTPKPEPVESKFVRRSSRRKSVCFVDYREYDDTSNSEIEMPVKSTAIKSRRKTVSWERDGPYKPSNNKSNSIKKRRKTICKEPDKPTSRSKAKAPKKLAERVKQLVEEARGYLPPVDKAIIPDNFAGKPLKNTVISLSSFNLDSHQSPNSLSFRDPVMKPLSWTEKMLTAPPINFANIQQRRKTLLSSPLLNFQNSPSDLRDFDSNSNDSVILVSSDIQRSAVTVPSSSEKSSDPEMLSSNSEKGSKRDKVDKKQKLKIIDKSEGQQFKKLKGGESPPSKLTNEPSIESAVMDFKRLHLKPTNEEDVTKNPSSNCLKPQKTKPSSLKSQTTETGLKLQKTEPSSLIPQQTEPTQLVKKVKSIAFKEKSSNISKVDNLLPKKKIKSVSVKVDDSNLERLKSLNQSIQQNGKISLDFGPANVDTIKKPIKDFAKIKKRRQSHFQGTLDPGIFQLKPALSHSSKESSTKDIEKIKKRRPTHIQGPSDDHCKPPMSSESSAKKSKKDFDKIKKRRQSMWQNLAVPPVCDKSLQFQFVPQNSTNSSKDFEKMRKRRQSTFEDSSRPPKKQKTEYALLSGELEKVKKREKSMLPGTSTFQTILSSGSKSDSKFKSKKKKVKFDEIPSIQIVNELIDPPTPPSLPQLAQRRVDVNLPSLASNYSIPKKPRNSVTFKGLPPEKMSPNISLVLIAPPTPPSSNLNNPPSADDASREFNLQRTLDNFEMSTENREHHSRITHRRNTTAAEAPAASQSPSSRIRTRRLSTVPDDNGVSSTVDIEEAIRTPITSPSVDIEDRTPPPPNNVN